VDRLGSSNNGMARADTSEAVAKAGLPQYLSNIVVSSNAVIGDLWLLACEKVKLKVAKEKYYKPLFERFFEIAERYGKQIDKRYKNYNDVNIYYQTLCRKEFGVLEIQERRLAFKTSSNVLKLNKVCRVSPPDWFGPGRRGQKHTFFGCHRPPPEVDDPAYFGYTCVVCGYKFVITPSSEAPVTCGKCHRFAHARCAKNLFMDDKNFLCSKIDRHLGRNSVELFGPKTVIREPLPRRHERCLICGDTDDIDVLCNKNCGFGCHSMCLEYMCGIMDREEIDAAEFCCQFVEYQIMPCEVVDMMAGEVDVVKAKVLKRGKVLSHKYNNRQKRWLNDEIECEFCGRWFGVNESRHVAQFCTGVVGDPISEANMPYPFAHIKRFKHLTRKTP